MATYLRQASLSSPCYLPTCRSEVAGLIWFDNATLKNSTGSSISSFWHIQILPGPCFGRFLLNPASPAIPPQSACNPIRGNSCYPDSAFYLQERVPPAKIFWQLVEEVGALLRPEATNDNSRSSSIWESSGEEVSRTGDHF